MYRDDRMGLSPPGPRPEPIPARRAEQDGELTVHRYSTPLEVECITGCTTRRLARPPLRSTNILSPKDLTRAHDVKVTQAVEL